MASMEWPAVPALSPRQAVFCGLLGASLLLPVPSGQAYLAPTSSPTLRGFRDLTSILETVAKDVVARGDDAEPPRLVILLERSPGILDELGSVPVAAERLFRTLPGGSRVGVRVTGGGSTVWTSEANALAGALRIPAHASPPRNDILREVRDALSEGPADSSPAGLIVLAEVTACTSSQVEGTITIARRRGTRVYFAAPEAPYESPGSLYMNCGFTRRWESLPVGSGDFAESRSLSIPFHWAKNLGGKFLYDSYIDRQRLAAKKELHRRLSADLDARRKEREERLREYLRSQGLPVPEEGVFVGFWIWGESIESSYQHWPLAGRARGETIPTFEASGSDIVPSGFGYWHLTRVAFATGGRYFITQFREAVCPFRAKYDPSLLARLEPRYEDSGGEAGGAGVVSGALSSAWTELESMGVLATERPTGAGSAGRPVREIVLEQGVPGSFASVGECRTAARRAESRAARLQHLGTRLGELSSRTRTDRGLGTDREIAALDALRVMVARAHVHCLAMAECLLRARDSDFHPSDRGGREGRGPRHPFLALQVDQRICRYWGGIESARAERVASLEWLPQFLADSVEAERAVAESVVARWEGAPPAAIALSGGI
jgi:hypothetical protein